MSNLDDEISAYFRRADKETAICIWVAFVSIVVCLFWVTIIVRDKI